MFTRLYFGVNRQTFLPNELSKSAIGCSHFGSTGSFKPVVGGWARESENHLTKEIMWCEASNIVIISTIYLVFQI